MNNLEKIDALYKIEYGEEKTIEMIGIEKTKTIAYAFITNDLAVDYFEFLNENGEVLKSQINISNLRLIGVTEENHMQAFKKTITEQLGYIQCDPSEKMVIGKKIELFVSQLGC